MAMLRACKCLMLAFNASVVVMETHFCINIGKAQIMSHRSLEMWRGSSVWVMHCCLKRFFFSPWGLRQTIRKPIFRSILFCSALYVMHMIKWWRLVCRWMERMPSAPVCPHRTIIQSSANRWVTLQNMVHCYFFFFLLLLTFTRIQNGLISRIVSCNRSE